MYTNVFAHRGYKLVAPENTLPSFQAALNYPVNGLEMDLQMTADGELVIIHDEKIDRTSNGSGFVKDKTLSELKKLDFGSWFSKKFKNVRILTFEEYLDWLYSIDYDRMLLIELKTDHFDYPGIEKKVLQIIKKFSAAKWQIVLQSFNPKTIHNLRNLDPEITLARLSFVIGPRCLFGYFFGRIQQINLSSRFLLNRLIFYSFKKARLTPWVVNRQSYLKKAFKFHLKAIITDQLDSATFLREQIQGINK
ncbi:glycerophosphodiester phosphodiesterase family protein [Oenococcus oeni]|uniref:glycerophosphodiester phosphodiesterase family protein n=1 Tax=Oenococcus oeni TaxID=1247 RepID=UPI0008F87044|nr:glycerophosphodiester phosphodiesterase family protein [Oenococcus oeni]OIL35644.1 glycerophosphodiester phosphodiesterase [Oenococcus oeni]